jgi:hypothetical protein
MRLRYRLVYSPVQAPVSAPQASFRRLGRARCREKKAERWYYETEYGGLYVIEVGRSEDPQLGQERSTIETRVQLTNG